MRLSRIIKEDALSWIAVLIGAFNMTILYLKHRKLPPELQETLDRGMNRVRRFEEWAEKRFTKSPQDEEILRLIGTLKDCTKWGVAWINPVKRAQKQIKILIEIEKLLPDWFKTK